MIPGFVTKERRNMRRGSNGTNQLTPCADHPEALGIIVGHIIIRKRTAKAIIGDKKGTRRLQSIATATDDSRERETFLFGPATAATNHDACGSCKGCAGSLGKVDEGLTCCELSGELFAELCGLGVTERETM